MIESETAPAAVSADPVLHRAQFHGSGGEYFRIWIVNLLLTLVTLGFYGPWAKVRRLRYFYGSTVLAGSSFEYHGEPVKILKGRLIALAVIAPYYLFQKTYPFVSLLFGVLFLIALPFIVVQSRRFQMRMSSWRNVHFGFGGRYGEAARIYIGFGLLIPLTLGLIAPYAQCAKQDFLTRESRFGGTSFRFEARPGRFYAAFFAALGGWLLSLLVVGIVVWALVARNGSGFNPASFATMMRSPLAVLVFMGAYLAMIASFLVPAAIWSARVTNESTNQTRLADHQLQSTLSVRGLVGLYVSNLLLTLITLGLYAPWAKIRLLRYRVENTAVLSHGSLDEFVDTASRAPAATAEELADFLDVDFGF